MTNDPNLESPLHRKQKDYWILDLGTAAPYYCKNKIYGIAILLRHVCRSVNVMNIINSIPNRRRGRRDCMGVGFSTTYVISAYNH